MNLKNFFVLLSLLIGINMHGMMLPDSTRLDSVGHKYYSSVEDSLAILEFDVAFAGKKAEMQRFSESYQSIHCKVKSVFSGIFYPETDYAIYNLRLKKEDDFNIETDKFTLRLSKLNDLGDKVLLKSYSYDTIDCLNFIIKLPYFPSLKNKYTIDYVDINGKISLFETIDLSYKQNSFLKVSEELYDKTADYVETKAESYKSFILNYGNENQALERLIYTQNQFNIFPPEAIVGSSKKLPPWCISPEPVNPCDSLFLKKMDK